MRTLFIVTVLLLCVCALVPAQEMNASVSGVVTDLTGAVVPNANITITNANTNVVAWRGRSGEAGLYQAPAIPVGTYNIFVEAAGFKKFEIRGLDLRVNQRARVDARLQPGEIVESITVAGEAITPLQTESSSLSETMNPTQVKDLPLPNRNILNLLTLVGGVSSGGAATGINPNQLSINGSRTLNSEFTVDGVSVVSGSTGGLVRLPSTEAVREFRVLTSGYSAEYGRTSGGSVNVVVDSGTNQLHGGLYEFFRNEKLNANDFFRNARGESRQQDRYNQFGAKLGGPVYVPRLYNGRDRTFFFFNYEGLRRREPSSQISTIPDERFRAGDFSASPVPVHAPGSPTPFPNNIIPASLIDPAARKIMGLLPNPNAPGNLDAPNNRRTNNFVLNEPTSPSNNEFTLRMDHNVSERARIFGRLTHYRLNSPRSQILPGPLEPAVGDSFTTGYQTSVGWTHTWSPTMISEATFGFMRDNPIIDPPSLGLDVQNILGIARSVGGASPRFAISGYQELGINSNTWRRQINNNYQASISFTWVRGSHVSKFGFQLRKNQFNVFNPGGLFTGLYNFNGQITSPNRAPGNPVNALADFLMGQVKTAQYELYQPPTGRRNYNMAFFGQDDWKVTPRLTLNLGLRYEFESAMTISNDIYSRIDVVTARLLVARRNASRTLNLDADKLNLAPRVGFAWSLDDKTVLRSAFGVFYSQIFSNLGGIVLYPGFTVRQNFADLGPGIAQPWRLSEGHPLVAVQDFNDPFFVEREATLQNPLTGAAQFGEISPLPNSLQWNFGIQREVARATVVDISYVGTRGLHLPLSLPFNQIPVERGQEVEEIGTQVARQLARPFPTVAQFGSFMHAGTSSYHGLQVKGTRNVASNVSFQAVYTFSKSIDDGSGIFPFSQPNGLDPGQFVNFYRFLNRSVSAFDRPQNFAMSLQYATKGPKWLRNIQINPIIVARDGLPDTITQNNLHPSAGQQRPDVINTNGGAFAPKRTSEGAAIRFLLPTSDPNFPFVPTGPLFAGSGANRRLVLPFERPGNLARNSTRDPGEVNVDLAVARRFYVSEKAYFTLRAEAFNLFNRVNLGSPNTGLSVIVDPRSGLPVWNSPNFGLITSARSARFMQLVARFDF
jgi:hypothetical protein